MQKLSYHHRFLLPHDNVAANSAPPPLLHKFSRAQEEEVELLARGSGGLESTLSPGRAIGLGFTYLQLQASGGLSTYLPTYAIGTSPLRNPPLATLDSAVFSIQEELSLPPFYPIRPNCELRPGHFSGLLVPRICGTARGGRRQKQRDDLISGRSSRRDVSSFGQGSVLFSFLRFRLMSKRWAGSSQEGAGKVFLSRAVYPQNRS